MATNDLIEIEGTLAQDAEVRTRLMGEGETPMPVLFLLINTTGASLEPVRAEQPYPPSHRAEADKAAKALRRGAYVTVKAPCAHIRTTLAYCASITVSAKAPHSKETSHV